ncbi:MAG: hypothetical protein ACYS99_23325, partial [Planctomycetota bacterium]
MTTTNERLNSPLLELLGPEVKGEYEKSLKALAEATSLRAEIEKLETPVRDLEERVGSKAAKGRRWKSLFADLVRALSRATELLTRVHEQEQASLTHFCQAVEEVRQIHVEGDIDIPPRTIEGLEKVIRLRTSEVEWLDAAVQHSRRVTGLTPDSAPPEVSTKLDQRRSYLDRIGTLKDEAETLERIVLGLPARSPVTSSAAQEEITGEHDEEDWEVWLKRVAAEDGHVAGSVPAAPPETLAKRFELLENELRELRCLAIRERDEFTRRAAESIRLMEE